MTIRRDALAAREGGVVVLGSVAPMQGRHWRDPSRCAAGVPLSGEYRSAGEVTRAVNRSSTCRRTAPETRSPWIGRVSAAG